MPAGRRAGPREHFTGDSLLLAYYSNQDIRRRIAEFLGEPGVVYVSYTDDGPALRPDEFWDDLPTQAELNRSVWDNAGLLVHLDVEYIHFDDPYAVYLEPQPAFRA